MPTAKQLTLTVTIVLIMLNTASAIGGALTIDVKNIRGTKGMLIEGYGTSNARGRYDELFFSEASFHVGKENTVVEVTMHYLGDK